MPVRKSVQPVKEKTSTAPQKPPAGHAIKPKRQMNEAAKRRIQSAEASVNGGGVKKHSFAARAQRKIDKP